MQPGFKAGLGDLVVGEIGGGDGDDINTVFTRSLAGNQRLVIRIAAFRRYAEIDAEVSAPFGIEVEGARDELVVAVAQGAGAVFVTYLSRASAAHHGPAQRA
ncbi:hypothetical protein D3C87_1588370 [compost metagenome]